MYTFYVHVFNEGVLIKGFHHIVCLQSECLLANARDSRVSVNLSYTVCFNL